MATRSTGKGRGWHGDPEGHARAGRKGGRASSGNFRQNPARASEVSRNRKKRSSE